MPQGQLLWPSSTYFTNQSVCSRPKLNVRSETSQPSIEGDWNSHELQVVGLINLMDLYYGHCTPGIVIRVLLTISIDIFDWKSTPIGNGLFTAYNSPDMTRNEVGPRPTLMKYLFWNLVAGQDHRLRIGHNHLGSVGCFSTETFSTEVPLIT